MILSTGQFLDSVRFNSLVLDQSTRFNQQLPLRFLDRLPLVPADDDEIIGTFTGQVFAADLIADDQAAAVYQAGQLTFVTNVIPNIKIGRRIGQGTLNRLSRLTANVGTAGDRDVFANWETSTVAQLLMGVRERMNAMACAMMLDNLSYSRLGIVINGSWGMPAGLKVTPATLWTVAATATPITDILTLKQSAADTYGQVYDRLTMSTTAFLNMASTTQFQQLLAGAPGVMNNIGTTAFNARDPRMMTFASAILQMEIELEDKQYTVQNADATTTTARVLPVNKVILSNAGDDGNRATWDFGNAIVTESIVAGMVGAPRTLGGERFGPMGYYTGNPDLNPPNLIAWAVARGFPRKHNPNASAVLTVA